MLILALDPGCEQSAWVVYDSENKVVREFGKDLNKCLRLPLLLKRCSDHLVVEMIKSYGNVMGDSVIETCVWIGRFLEMWGGSDYSLIPRKTVVTQICNNPRAKDSNVRQALIDRFSGGKGEDVAIGKKMAPGPLYGLKNDIWSALAVAVAWDEIQKQTEVQLERALK